MGGRILSLAWLISSPLGEVRAVLRLTGGEAAQTSHSRTCCAWPHFAFILRAQTHWVVCRYRLGFQILTMNMEKKKQQNSVPGHHPASIGSGELCELLPFSCLVGQLSYLCNKLTCSITYSFLQVVSVEYCCQAGPVPGCGDVSQPRESVVEKAAAGDIGIPY